MCFELIRVLENIRVALKADLETSELIHARASLLKKIRVFFEAEGLVEVDTPLLYPCATPDPYIHHLSLAVRGEQYFLQSSPEFAMKRLLEKTPVPMYQICKAFRNDGEGSRHKTEFTMIEWYVPRWNLEQLLQQCIRLFECLFETTVVSRISYRDAFLASLNMDPFNSSQKELQSCIKESMDVSNLDSLTKEECIHLLFAEEVEKYFDPDAITFVEDFPAEQAALASCEKDECGNQVAKRFEIYFSGLELANAYQEESESEILRQRFEKDNQLRLKSGMPEIPIDNEFLKAMKNFPPCAGIALGFDRLLMCKLKVQSIQQLDIF